MVTIYNYDKDTRIYTGKTSVIMSANINPEDVITYGQTLVEPDLSNPHIYNVFDCVEKKWIQHESFIGRSIINLETKEIQTCYQHTVPEGYSADIPDRYKIPYLYWDGDKFVCDRKRLIVAIYDVSRDIFKRECKEPVSFLGHKIYLGKSNILALISGVVSNTCVKLADVDEHVITLYPYQCESLLRIANQRRTELMDSRGDKIENLPSMTDDELFDTYKSFLVRKFELNM